MKKQQNLIGAAGEHLVLSRLLQREIPSALSPFNTYKADIFVNSLDGKDAAYIQVKTTTSKKQAWKVSEKDMKHQDMNMFYCFVELNSSPQKVYVIPARKVSEVLTESHRVYMRTPKRDGSKRTSHKFRLLKNNFLIDVKSAPDNWMDEYLEKWELLG